MRKVWITALAAMGMAALSSPSAAQPADIAADCNRSCLGQKLDQFLDAVAANDPAAAGLWIGFRQTQNAQLTAAGEGIWASNTGIGALDRRFFDETTGQAEFFGTISEGEETAIASLRIKVEENAVTEAEWHIARAGDPDIRGTPEKIVFDVENLLANPLPQRVVPQADRSSRRALVAAVNSYFDGIVNQTGRHVQANPGCLRLENGLGGPAWTGGPVMQEDADFQDTSDCRSRYAGLNIVNVAARRYLMVDEQAQVVVASAVFMREPLSPKRRNCFMEIFVMDGGKISSVYAAMVYADPTLPLPNWAPYEGNYPIPQNLVPHG